MDSPAAPTSATASLTDTFKELLHELPGLVSDRVELLSLELHRAGLALARIVALGLLAAIFVATAWLALWAGVIAWLMLSLGLHWGWALLIALLLNGAGAALALSRARGLAGLLTLPATQRHLMFRPPVSTTAPVEADHAHTSA